MSKITEEQKNCIKKLSIAELAALLIRMCKYEVAQLKAEVEQLKAENAKLKEMLANF